MSRVITQTFLTIAFVAFLSVTGYAQDKQAMASQPVIIAKATSDLSDRYPPLRDAATTDQIREYLRLSGDLDSFRARWIAAVDENRSLGAPYWPESFWTAFKAEIQKTDLMPMFTVVYQHGVSKDLMQEVLDAYQRLGTDHFKGSPECIKFSSAEMALEATMDELKLAKTQEVADKIYDIYRPEIKAARQRYKEEHPDWVDK